MDAGKNELTAPKTYALQARTNIWTGDANRNNQRLITTGLLGSIRWWFEVVVRGLGGSACDPTATDCEGNKHCVVCELFGCTSWARKFRFDVLNLDKTPRRNQIKQGCEFQLRFTPLRPIRDEEWALLDLTLRIIADYGAMGGKTVLKPSDEQGRDRGSGRDRHGDYGLIKITEAPEVDHSRNALESYVQQPQWDKPEHSGFAWASLDNFWCVNGRYLARQSQSSSSFNKVIGRPESKRDASQHDSWLAGCRPNRNRDVEAESKKIFSFKDPPRTFGFVRSQNQWSEIKTTLSSLGGDWEHFDQSREFHSKKEILEGSLSEEKTG